MAIKKSQIALHVRVKFNENFKPKCLGDEYLLQDKIIFIKGKDIYNDSNGDYIFVGSAINSTTVYLNEIDLEFPIDDYGIITPSKLELRIEELKLEINVLNEKIDFIKNDLNDVDGDNKIDVYTECRNIQTRLLNQLLKLI